VVSMRTAHRRRVPDLIDLAYSASACLLEYQVRPIRTPSSAP